jgi:carbamoyltransferase
VHRESNRRYHALLTAFKAVTGCPMLVNTSFNVRGEPIVGTPEDAFRCFIGTEIEALAIGNCFLRKPDQDEVLRQDYKSAIELD